MKEGDYYYYYISCIRETKSIYTRPHIVVAIINICFSDHLLLFKLYSLSSLLMQQLIDFVAFFGTLASQQSKPGKPASGQATSALHFFRRKNEKKIKV